MILNLTDVSSEPLHLQIRRQIRALILAGDMDDGESLPSIRGLAKQERVSVITVQRAYDDLEREGLILARRGKGFFVISISMERKTNMAQERLKDSLSQVLDAARAEGLSAPQIERVFSSALSESGLAMSGVAMSGMARSGVTSADEDSVKGQSK